MLHDALRVIAGTREMGALENESKADSLSMAISGISLAGCANYAVGSESFYALNWCGAPFCWQAPEKGLSGWSGRQVWLGKRRLGGCQLEGPAMRRTCSPTIRFRAHIATIEQYPPKKLTIQKPSALLK